ncbi:hypothetical protein V2J09_007000 [Rumex salicifolius]
MESRAVGAAEQSWCRALPGGTGITVVALLFSKQPDMRILQNALHKVQNLHPILRSKLHLDPRTRKFSFVTPTVSDLQVKSIDLRSTMEIVQVSEESVSPFQTIVEHELNLNPWENPRSTGSDLMEAKVYEMEGGEWTVTVKAHTAACDRTASDTVLREVVGLLLASKAVGAEMEIKGKGEVKMGMEEYVPGGKGKKSLWARGVNMLGYSLNSFRLSNIEFVDTRSPRRTQLASLRLEPEASTRLLQEKGDQGVGSACSGGIDGGAAHQGGCPISKDINGRERLWDLAERTYRSSDAAKTKNKHFSDMADLTFLMCRAIENPGLTPSSSLRTSFLSVFEDVPTHDDEPDYMAAGVVDYIATSSVHGVGPTLALFAQIRDGGLDCRYAYPSPLHSRDQIRTLLHHVKTIVMEAV